MTPYRIYEGEKIFIHDHFVDGHINLYINNIASRRGTLDSFSRKLSLLVGVDYHDQSGVGKRVWKITRDQFRLFEAIGHKAGEVR